MRLRILAAAALAIAATSSAAESPALLGTQANDTATRDGVAGLLRAQVLLDRANFSPGEIDGLPGSNQRRALRGYQKSRGLDVSGELDEPTWNALNANAAPVVTLYTLTDEDVEQHYARIPEDMMDQAKLPSLGFESTKEALGERFHVAPSLLEALNPGADFTRAGARIHVPHVADVGPSAKAAKVVIDKSDATLTLFDADGQVIAQFPVSSGSEKDPLPIGEWKILGTAVDPTFHYNPELFWDADPSHAKATLPAGPNNPVGTRWIDLSKPHYGLHGTPLPATVGKAQSHGCVRLTNWDVERVAAAVSPSTPVVMQE